MLPFRALAVIILFFEDVELFKKLFAETSKVKDIIYLSMPKNLGNLKPVCRLYFRVCHLLCFNYCSTWVTLII